MTLTSSLSALRWLALSKARGGQGRREQHPQTGARGTCQQLRLAGSSTRRSLALSGCESGETGSQAVWAGPGAYACSRKSKPHFLSWSFSKCFKAGSFGQMPFAPRGAASPKMPAGKSAGSRVTESGQRRLRRWGRLGAMAPWLCLSPSLSGRPLLTSSKAPGIRLQDTGSP